MPAALPCCASIASASYRWGGVRKWHRTCSRSARWIRQSAPTATRWVSQSSRVRTWPTPESAGHLLCRCPRTCPPETSCGTRSSGRLPTPDSSSRLFAIPCFVEKRERVRDRWRDGEMERWRENMEREGGTRKDKTIKISSGTKEEERKDKKKQTHFPSLNQR